MSKNIDCEVFQDQLDSLKQGTLSRDGETQLGLHAEACAECAMLLRLHGHLAAPSLAELEAVVPDLYVASMWERVQADVAAGAKPGSRFGGWQPARWLVPTLAAASALLLVSTSFLLAELRTARGREQTLVARVESHERRLAELESALTPRATLTGLAGRRVWERALAGKESVTLGELTALLEGLPARTTLLSPSSARALGDMPGWVTFSWRDGLGQLDLEDGAQASELLEVLQGLALDPGTRIRVDRLLAVRRGEPRRGRS
ncbi:MAG TPA: hypothetical protein VLC48_04310 [Gemmatimonadota bacterium]|nr:hypothetical protein [Gemmatimonadota bacterium]